MKKSVHDQASSTAQGFRIYFRGWLLLESLGYFLYREIPYYGHTSFVRPQRKNQHNR